MYKIVMLALIVWFAGCSTMKIQSDYDPSFDFKPLQTFAVVYPEERGAKTLTQTRIAEAVTAELVKKGYRSVVKEQADFIVLFHTDVTSRRQVVTDYQMVGYYPYYGYGASMAVPVEREYTYDEAKIIVDALNPRGNRIFWRTVATDELKSFDSPQERIAYINRVVGSAMKSFPKMQKAP